LHTGEFYRASSGKGSNGKDVSKAKRLAKPSQKRRPEQLSEKMKSGQSHLRKEGQNNYRKR
jgi:hypothetical protein